MRPGVQLRAYRCSRAEIAVSVQRLARQLAIHEEVGWRHQVAGSLLAIVRATVLARGTSRKLAHVESFSSAAQEPCGCMTELDAG